MAVAWSITPTTSSSWSAPAPNGCGPSGHSQSELAEHYGYVFAVAEVKVNYRKPARLDDELRITCVPVPEGQGVDPFHADDLARRRAAHRRRHARRLRRCEDFPSPAAAGIHHPEGQSKVNDGQ